MNKDIQMPIHIDSRIPKTVVKPRVPGSREHGPMPPKNPNYFARRAGVLAVGVAGVVGGAAFLNGGDSSAEISPTETTIVIAEKGDEIWNLQRADANSAGVHPEADIRAAIDKAVEMNGGAPISPGDPVALVDFKDK